uniref:Secreted protein n=1 Tax=Setaria viridis TaxID=4556 RepID=A0A4U6SWP9_SETVI|nr:hypothetical protein SEVIR_9G195233v2 [Setaria viridis]
MREHCLFVGITHPLLLLLRWLELHAWRPNRSWIGWKARHTSVGGCDPVCLGRQPRCDPCCARQTWIQCSCYC